MKEGVFIKKEREPFSAKKETEKKLVARYESSLDSCGKKLENAFKRIANLIGDEKEIDDILELKRAYFRQRNKDPKSAEIIEEEYREKVNQVKQKLIDEIFNPKRKFTPSQVEPWQREDIKTREKYSQRFYSQDLALLRDKEYFVKLKDQLNQEKFNNIFNKRNEVFLKHLVLKNLIGFSPKKSDLDFFYERNKQLKISEIIKDGGYLVKFFNREGKHKFLDRGAIKLEVVSSKNKKPVIRIEKMSENLEKKNLIPKKEFSVSDKSLPLFLKLIIQVFLKDLKKQGS